MFKLIFNQKFPFKIFHSKRFNHTVLYYPLHRPSLQEISFVIKQSLTPHFQKVETKVLECPDLTQNPFRLASEGICGKPCLADVGSPSHLFPKPNDEKVYDLLNVAELLQLPDGFLLGSSLGFEKSSFYCDLIANIKTGPNITNRSLRRRSLEEKKSSSDIDDSTQFRYVGNFFGSEGKRGDVIMVKAKRRQTSEKFVDLIRKSLSYHYVDQPVGIGGVFLINRGLSSDQTIQEKLESSDIAKSTTPPNPVVCFTTFISHDPGLDLWLELTHCFSKRGDCGNFKSDLSPDTVEYIAYLNVAESIYRIDKPLKFENKEEKIE